MPKALNQIGIFQKVIISNSEGQILALRRRDNDSRRPGAWDLPGGGFEKGEDLESAAKREVLEETGLIAQSITVIVARTVKGMAPPEVDNIFIGWVAKDWSGEITLSDEHVEYRWVTPSEFALLPTWDEQGFLQGLVKQFHLQPRASQASDKLGIYKEA